MQTILKNTLKSLSQFRHLKKKVGRQLTSQIAPFSKLLSAINLRSSINLVLIRPIEKSHWRRYFYLQLTTRQRERARWSATTRAKMPHTSVIFMGSKALFCHKYSRIKTYLHMSIGWNARVKEITIAIIRRWGQRGARNTRASREIRTRLRAINFPRIYRIG